MFSEMIQHLPCDACKKGRLLYSQRLTMEAWQQPEVFRLDDLGKLKDGVISDILVMVCTECEVEVRYTLKEIEKVFRKRLSDRLFTMFGRADLPDPGGIRKTNRIFYYCNKCTGYDGKGSCPQYIYNNCEIKRLPYGF